MTSILRAESVDVGYFLERVKQFEKQYNKHWRVFFEEFKKSPDMYINRDFNEWAFLCETFYAELTANEKAE